MVVSARPIDTRLRIKLRLFCDIHMYFFSSGIFHVGGSDFAGPKYFMDEDIILVTINYRVGSFGKRRN